MTADIIQFPQKKRRQKKRRQKQRKQAEEWEVYRERCGFSPYYAHVLSDPPFFFRLHRKCAPEWPIGYFIASRDRMPIIESLEVQISW